MGVADSNGNLVGQIRYTAFGEYRSGYTAAAQSGYHFTGQLSKMGTVGLYFYKSRWFDPVSSHFASADTVVPDPFSPLDWDRYQYVHSNPSRHIDPQLVWLFRWFFSYFKVCQDQNASQKAHNDILSPFTMHRTSFFKFFYRIGEGVDPKEMIKIFKDITLTQNYAQNYA